MALLAAAVAAGCGRGEGDGGSAPAAQPQPAQPALDLVAYRSPSDFPLPFRAWVPAAARVTAQPTGRGAGVRILLQGDTGSVAPYLNLYVFPSGTPREQAEAQAEGELADLGVPVSQGEAETSAAPNPRFDWALAQAPFRYERGGHGYTGTVLTGAHGGRYFNLTLHGPLPRARWWPAARAVLDSWHWADGTPLVRVAPDASRSGDGAAGSTANTDTGAARTRRP